MMENQEYSYEEIQQAKKEFADALVKTMPPEILLEFVKVASKLKNKNI